MTHKFSPGIFREYDIRGIIGQTLNPADAYFIARAFSKQILDSQTANKAARVCIGYDGRLSSPSLVAEITRGFTDSGIEVIDIGIGPTPMLYYAAKTLGASAGLMVTGSHNPPSHNGFKFVLQNKPFYGEDIQKNRVIAEAGTYPEGKGSTQKKDLRADYIATLLKAYNGKAPLTIAWDAGNGAAGEIMEAICAKLPGKHHSLNGKIDGTFPAHHPDPSVAENLQQLIEEVKKNKCHAGIAFDGDGDRIGIVDDEGTILWGDQLLMLYAADVLADHPGALIIADVKASGALFEEIERLGGKPLMWKTGHSLIKSKMLETGALLAGEMSGHMFFADRYYGYDDALYAAVRLVGYLSRTGKKLSDLRKSLPSRINTPEIRFPCDDDRKFAVIEEVKQRLEKSGADFSAVDGVRVNKDGGWWLLRASNTQAVLVARCEAKTAKSLEDIKADLRQQLALSKVSLP